MSSASSTTPLRLVLGTVQLGLSYGIANAAGKPSLERACEIVEAAWQGGIRRFDTAQAYGDSEAVLGAALAELGHREQARITTKLQWSPDDTVPLRDRISASCQRLGVDRLESVLFHDESCLAPAHADALNRAVDALVNDARIGHVGVSVYTREGAQRALALPGISAIQIPGNALDRRFAAADFLEDVAARQVRLQVRSVFLQGLLLMVPERVPAHLNDAVPHLHTLQSLADDLCIARAALALAYAAHRWPDAEILIGAETPTQVRQNLEIWSSVSSVTPVADIESALPVGAVPEFIIRPDQWRSA